MLTAPVTQNHTWNILCVILYKYMRPLLIDYVVRVMCRLLAKAPFTTDKIIRIKISLCQRRVFYKVTDGIDWRSGEHPFPLHKVCAKEEEVQCRGDAGTASTSSVGQQSPH